MVDKVSKIRQEIAKHASNAWARQKGYEPLFSASPSSKIVVVGQAPGIRAQTSKIPWDDASGRRLREWMQVSDEEFYDLDKIALIPMDFYYPGKGKSGDLPPRKDFASMWHPQLFEIMQEVELILLIGQYAQAHYLQDKKYKTLTETVKNYKEFLPDYFVLPHPSPRNGIWLAKNGWFEEDVLPDLGHLVRDALAD